MVWGAPPGALGLLQCRLVWGVGLRHALAQASMNRCLANNYNPKSRRYPKIQPGMSTQVGPVALRRFVSGERAQDMPASRQHQPARATGRHARFHYSKRNY